MRLKASIKKPEVFRNILEYLKKVDNNVEITFTPEFIGFSSGKSSQTIGNARVKGYVKTEGLFEGYDIESEMDNTIIMEMSSQNIFFVFNSTGNDSIIRIQLQKELRTGAPLLVISIDNFITQGIKVVQKVPIVLKKEISDQFPQFTTQGMVLFFPNLEPLKKVVSSIKQISSSAKIRLFEKKLELEVSNESVSIKSYFLNMIPTEETVSRGNVVEINIDLRLLAKALECKNIGTEHHSIFVVHNTALTINAEVSTKEIVFTTLIPGIL